MGATTPNYLLPYPLGTDRVADGDNAIRALAEKLDTDHLLPTMLAPGAFNNSVSPATPLSAYPRGLSIYQVQASAGFGAYVTLVTFKADDSYGTQIVAGASGHFFQLRAYDPGAGTWFVYP